jgi:hypothetical protein
MNGYQRFTLLTALALPVLLMGGCVGEPTIQTGDDAEIVLGTLAKVDNSQVDLAYVDPNVDYTRYSKVFIMPLDVDNIKIRQPQTQSSMLNRYNREWELTDSERLAFQDAYRAAMEKALSKDGVFDVTDQRGDDVIAVQGMITGIAPAGPKDDARSRVAGRSDVYTEGAGAMSIAMMLADGDSGEVIAIFKDTRRGQQTVWGLNNSVTNMAEVRRYFSIWARQLHDGLLQRRQKFAEAK